ncbi:MAG: sulfatase-like hydrolase/transferase [Gammaproteobacteria bacterium]|nr:sulfatase-like hydrolase/transferase [Gammaproteobacteria bacterium]
MTGQTITHKLIRKLSPFGPLAPVVAFACLFLLFFSISRLLLALIYFSEINTVKGVLWLFPVGMRMDSIILSALLLIPTLLLLLMPPFARRWWYFFIAGLFALFSIVLIYFEITTYTFLSVYNARPNHLFVEYMASPGTVLDIVLTNYKLPLFLGLVLMATVGWWIARFTWQLMCSTPQWAWWKRLLITPLVVLLLASGVRSSLSDSPANLGSAAFSEDNLVNELALNSSYAVAYATYNFFNQQQNLAEKYGHMTENEMIRRVQQQTGLPMTAFDDPAIPLAHVQTPNTPLAQPRNLVIILSESLSAEFIGSLGGLPLSPQFDALSQQGILFDNLYATGKRTNRGLESVITGALPIPLTSAIKLRLAQSDFFTLPALLKTHGYQTGFLYGGDANFDNMRRFLSYNGVDQIIEGSDINNARFRNHWGVSDDDIFSTANSFFRTQANNARPFVGIILTLSNHEPFDFPDSDFELYEQPRATQNNVAKYADHALGRFFAQARKETYFNNTVFLIVADHGVEIQARGLIPAAKYHVPALILGPDIAPQRINTLASQIDLPPTVLGLLGITTRHPMPGRNLLNLPADLPGRAIYHLGSTYAYQVENSVILLRPGHANRQYHLRDGKLTPITLEPELEKDALAHLLLPDLLHRQQRYRLSPHP